jgi:WD40 repeat protein
VSSWQQRALAATAAIHVGGSGQPAGTGVLIEPDKVLTCRHVVAAKQGQGPVKPGISVRLPGLSPFEDVWPEQDEWQGVDAVVLTLPVPADVEPVALSGSLRAPAKVELLGYPQADRTEEGVWRSFTVHAETKSLVQLDWTDAGSIIGHSGGPVLDADSGKLVGILLEGSPDGRFDRYVPLWRLMAGGVLGRLPWLVDGDDAEGHFARRSTGRRGSTGRDVFTGRQAALDRLADWLAGPGHTGRVLVVTGQPGAGKSAVTARAGLRAASELGQGSGWRGLLFHARAADAAAFRRAVADLFGSGADHSSYALLEDADRLASESPVRRWLLVVDALDEASRPADREQIATLVEELARRPWVRAVVAARPLSAQGPAGETSLLQRLGIHDTGDEHLLNLDSDIYFEEADVELLAARLLTQDGQKFPLPQTAAEAYRADSKLRERLARVIAQRGRRNFLVVAMTASRLADARTVVDPVAPGFNISALPTSVGGALDQFLDSRQDGAQLRGILTALAYAEGTGMDDRTWRTAAEALGYPVTQAGLDALRDSPIADYLLQSSTETDGRVIRLFHQALADQLRRHRDQRDDQDAITTALTDEGRHRGWADCARYTPRYLAAHAGAAGRTSQLLLDLDFLLHADLANVRRTLSVPLGARAAEVAALLLSEGSRADGLARDQRAEFLALHAAHLGLPALTRAFNAMAGATWQPVWAHPLGSYRTVLEGFDSSVAALTAVSLPDGRTLLACAGDNGKVRLWDPVTGTPVGDPLEGHDVEVNALTAVPWPDGRTLLASASTDRTIRLWDPVTGTPVGDPLEGHDVQVNALTAVPWPDGRTLLASASTDRTIRLWDPVTGTPVGDPLEGHDVQVNALTAVPWPDGRTLLAYGDSDGKVWLWDPDTGAPADSPLEGRIKRVSALTAVPLPDGRTLLASAGPGGSVRLWDPGTGAPVGSPLETLAAVTALTVVPLPEGRTFIASGSFDGSVRLWDPVTGIPAGAPLEGHTREVMALTVVPLPEGRTLIASGSFDGSVRLWDPVTGAPADSRLEGHNVLVNGLTAVPLPDGRTLLASASGLGEIRLWDPLTGTQAGDPLESGNALVNVLTAVSLPDGRTLLACAGDNGKVRLWDPVTGTPVGDPLDSHSGWVQALTAVPWPDGRTLLAAGGSDRKIRLWDPVAGTLVGDPLEGHDVQVNALTAVPWPDGRTLLASASTDGTIRLWDPVAGTPVGDPLESHGHVNVLTVVPLPDGRTLLASTNDSNTVLLWDLVTGTLDSFIRLDGTAPPLTATCSQIVAGTGRSLVAFKYRSADVRPVHLPYSDA